MTGVNLPRPPRPFDGRIERLITDAKSSPLRPERAPKGAPNIVLIMLDDVGFGSFGTFGGPVPTPALDAVAAAGLRYNQFHTTALCSPTRAALLTGRNHHAVHMGGIPEGANSFPGYDSVIPRSSASVAEILRQNGWATGCFGKWHLTPTWEQGPAGPFDRWPTGMGFEKFYGIINAEASQWEPPVYDQTVPVFPYRGRPDYHLTEDLVDQSIIWLERLRATAPERPYFLYLPTPAVHTPHHAPKAWIDRFAGQFDQGWDALREQIFQRQLAMGVIPSGTRLTPRPDEIPSWADYPDRFKPVARRLMEVFAGFLAHTDHHIGRLLQFIEASGEADNTLVIYITGDNGASAEGTVNGAWAAPSFQNGLPEDPEWLLAHIDDFGSAACENHFNVGWAWALDAPFQWMKQVASHFGGTRNAMALSWPSAISAGGELRTQFHHVIDIAPTILAAAGLEAPTSVNGVEQAPMDGVPMNYSFDQATAPSARTTQYFEILGNRAIYHQGWMASCFHGRVPWLRFMSVDFDGPQERWELYNLADDFSQSEDLAALFPERLAELLAVFDTEARRNGVYPLRDPARRSDPGLSVPSALGAVRSVTYTTAHVRIPETVVVNLKNCSYRIAADIEIRAAPARGVIACQGGNMAGWSIYLDEAGIPHFLYNYFGRELTFLAGPAPLIEGRHHLELRFAYDGGLGAGGELSLDIDGETVSRARLERTVPVVFSMSGETFDVGMDTGAPVGPYPHVFECTARILGVTLERMSELSAADREDLGRREFRASLSSQ
ncbi:MAG: arylsulfatase [Caulobacter sp.]|nr:arylsulfatase [Caulobacter sp.]